MSYPELIKSSLGNLSGYLLSRPTQEELHAKGGLSNEAQKYLDCLILNDLAQRIRGYYLPVDFARGTNPNNKWRVVSCLQKAIRFGDSEMAQFAASVLYDLDKDHLFRRLSVIAVEDVGAGSVYGMLATLAVRSSAAWRRSVDERRLGCFLAKMLAEAPKDRTLCDLLVVVDYDRAVEKVKLATKNDDALAERIRDPSLSIKERMCAAWLLAGTKRFPGLTMPEDNDRPTFPLLRLMVEEGLSRGMLYLASKTAGRTGSPMWVSFLFFDQWLRRTDHIGFVEAKLPPTPKIGKLLGASYDMFTREGRIAIGKFKKENMGVLKPFLRCAHSGMEDTLLHHGLFQVEGGMLRVRVTFRNSERVRNQAKLDEMTYTGIGEDILPEFLQVLRENLPALNECRAKVLYAMLKG